MKHGKASLVRRTTVSALVTTASVALACIAPAIVAASPAGPAVHVARPATTPPAVVLPAPAAVGQAVTIAVGIHSSLGLSAQLTVSRDVVSVAPDTSYVVRTQMTSLQVTQMPTGYDASALDGLVGLSMTQNVDPAGNMIGSPQPQGTVTDQQLAAGERLLSWFGPAGVGFPGGPISVGTSWTAAGLAGSTVGLVVPVTYYCRLAGADELNYTLEVSYAQDFDVTENGLGQVVGTISGQGTLQGSRTNPLVLNGTINQSTDGLITGDAPLALVVTSELTLTTVNTVG